MSVHEVLDRVEPANFLRGGWQAGTGGVTAVINPADPADRIATVPDSTAGDVDAAVAVARRAAPAWAATPAPARGDVLRRWNELIGEHAEELAALMTREMGKPLAESRGEIGRARLELDYAAGEGTRLHGTTVPSRAAGQLVFTEREPLGVVAAITPWNFPAVAPIRKLGPALVTGNTVVLKPAYETPLTALALGGLLRDAGLPDGVLGVVCGDGDRAGARLAEHPDVAAVSFTGSTAVGRGIAEVVARRLGAVQLELGGKNAAYVHSARDLDRVVDQITGAAVQASGQRCTAISRVIADDSVADDLVARLSARYSALRVGPGAASDTEVGPLISDEAVQKVNGYIGRGLAEGAVRTTRERNVPAGRYVAPVVLDHVRPEMTVARDEIFGPVLTVTRVAGVDEAIAVANDSEYGLAAVVFSTDLEVSLRFARATRTGMVHVNHGTTSQPHVPFGGVHASGVGEFSIGYTSTDFFTDLKVVYLSLDAPE